MSSVLHLLRSCLSADGWTVLGKGQKVTEEDEGDEEEEQELSAADAKSLERYFVFATVWGIAGGLPETGV